MLPFWVVQGPTRSFGAAKMGSDGRMTVWHCSPIGESSDYTGVCQILAALDTTITWAQYDYRPWFERYCLRRDPATIPANAVSSNPIAAVS